MKLVQKRFWSLLLCTALVFTMLPFSTTEANAEENYSITYDSAGAASGSVPADAGAYAQDDTVTVLDNTGNLTRPGYIFGGSLPADTKEYPEGAIVTVQSGDQLTSDYGFKCWNTESDGSGTDYSDGSLLAMGTESVTLYAIYNTAVVVVLPTNTLTYNANGAGSGTVPASASDTQSDFTVSGNTGSLLKTGSQFAGWNTKSDGSGTTYQAGETMSVSGSQTLYALWKTVYVVTYLPNGGTLWSDADNTDDCAAGSNLRLPGFLSMINPPSLGWDAFIGWNTEADGSGTAYMPGDVITPSSNLTLYARWQSFSDIIGKYDITYDGNGNDGGSLPAISYISSDTTVTVAAQGTLTRSNYQFEGWSDGNGLFYSPGTKIQVSKDTILYARWLPTYTVTYNVSGTSLTAPTDATVYVTGENVTVLGTLGTEILVGSSLFYWAYLTGWSTAPNGGGTVYAPGDSFAITENTTLYAVYSTTSPAIPLSEYCTVTYSSYGATSGAAPVDSSLYSAGSTVTVLGAGSLSGNGNFSGWQRGDGSGTTYQPGSTFTFPKAKGVTNLVLFPTFKTSSGNTVSVKGYFINYSSNGADAGSVPSDGTNYITDDLADAMATVKGNTGGLVRSGYVFAGWSVLLDGSGTVYQAGDTITFNGNVYLYAVWQTGTRSHTVMQSESGTVTNTRALNEAADVTVLSPTYSTIFYATSSGDVSNYFSHWNTNSDDTSTSYAPGDHFTMLTGDVTLYAIYDTVPVYFVSYDSGNSVIGECGNVGGGYHAGDTVTAIYPSSLTGPDSTYFSGWNTEPDGSGALYQAGDTFSMGSSNITLYATWVQYNDRYTVTYDGDGYNSGTLPDGVTTYDGSTITLPTLNSYQNSTSAVTLQKSGFILYGWYADGTFYEPGGSFTMPYYSVIIKAAWRPLTYPRTVNVSYSGTGSTGGTAPASSDLSVGSTLKLPDNTGGLTRTGYVFAGWSDGNAVYQPGAAYSSNQLDDVTFGAVWKQAYTVVYSASGNSGGMVPQDDTSYTQGETVTIADNSGGLTRGDALFAGWCVNGQIVHPGDILMMGSSDVTATAVWASLPATEYSVTVQTNGYGQASANISSAAEGTEITLTATPSDGYYFKEWQVASPASIIITGNTFTMPNEDVTVKAVFEAGSMAVTGIAVSDAGGAGSVAVGGILQMLASVSPDNANNKNVTWSIASGSGAAIDANGLLTATTVGTVTVRAAAQDGSGVYGEAVVTIVSSGDTVEINIAQNPIKTIINALTFGLFFDDTIDVSITLGDSTVDHYEYQIVDSGDTFDASGTWTQGASFSVNPDFKGYVYARAVFSGGNISDYTYKALVVDTTKPEISANYDASSGSIAVSVTDSGGGIGTITYQVGSDEEQTITLTPSSTQDIATQHDFIISSLPDGRYDVVIGAVDNSGNGADIQTVPIDQNPVGVDAMISPAARSYDLVSPSNASTNITWNSANSVTDVVYDEDFTFLAESSDYTVTGSALTIKSSYLQTLGLSAGDSAKFTIYFDTGSPVTFTVDFVDSYTLSGNANLRDLTVNGTTVTDFDPDITDYYVELPYGTARAPVGAVADDSHAAVDITQADSLPGTGIVEVTAEDTSISKEYVIHFTLADTTPTSHGITVRNNGHGTGSATPAFAETGTKITLTATPNRGYYFKEWQVVSPKGLSITNSTFTMPDEAVTVKAIFSTNGSSGGNSGGSSGTATTPDSVPEKQPDQPVIGAVSVTATMDAEGTSSAVIPDQSVIDAIAKAQADAKEQGKTADGISIALNITAPAGTKALSSTLSQTALKALADAGVTSLEIGGLPISVRLDRRALGAVRSQSSGDITITAVVEKNLSDEAKNIIGTRPVYNITVCYTINGGTSAVANLGGGTAMVSIPYTPAQGEAAGYLYGVYVDDKGTATRIDASAYDANSGCLIFTTNHFSIYGVGYTAPSTKFTDISRHWAKDSIDYVVSRGLLLSTSNTTFAPDNAMTRGMLVTALGRQARADVSGYTTSSFTDVEAGSTFQPYIEWAYKKGIIQGIGNGQFASDRAVTREEIAVILQNYAKVTDYTLPVTRVEVTFGDNGSIGSAYKGAVKAMQQAGIMQGGNNNKFNPGSSATRGEVAAMLTRYIKLTIDPATAQGWGENDSGQRMYFEDGIAVTSWKDFGEGGDVKRYYFNTNGVMEAGKWVEIDGKWYYFYVNGSLAVNTTINGYEVDENGVRVTD